ncbi:hypothetical protein GNF18_06375 [Ligilactobacillus pobuzihii]|uniref:hypothetical protein n=1 Tax=Ligilactobacillus pobuzihii TaxID=449659 RepID=UPI0019D13512|nr:hypothetical protein [Ligilactobacillus pobuzihii]MBN7274758.1 hypothetical protein [Ligilactobacillus pobuzihii]
MSYVGQHLKEKFRKMDYLLWTPYRSNMQNAKEHNNRVLKRLHRIIEASFPILVNKYGIELNLTRSLVGFWVKIELTVSVHNLDFFAFDESRIITN